MKSSYLVHQLTVFSGSLMSFSSFTFSCFLTLRFTLFAADAHFFLTCDMLHPNWQIEKFCIFVFISFFLGEVFVDFWLINVWKSASHKLCFCNLFCFDWFVQLQMAWQKSNTSFFILLWDSQCECSTMKDTFNALITDRFAITINWRT